MRVQVEFLLQCYNSWRDEIYCDEELCIARFYFPRYGPFLKELSLIGTKNGCLPFINLGDIDTWCDPHICVGIALGGYVANPKPTLVRKNWGGRAVGDEVGELSGQCSDHNAPRELGQANALTVGEREREIESMRSD
eukprot:sb/3474516/